MVKMNTYESTEKIKMISYVKFNSQLKYVHFIYSHFVCNITVSNDLQSLIYF